jgi:3',5'-cyclic AMP phosphodiesterase CpdA
MAFIERGLGPRSATSKSKARAAPGRFGPDAVLFPDFPGRRHFSCWLCGMRRVAHLSDLHFGTEQGPVVEQLGESLAAFAPHLVIVTGDLTQRARPAEFERARAFLATLPAPHVVVPGNHDIAPLYRPLQRLRAPYARYQRYIEPELDGLWQDEELLVLGLSSVQPWRWKEGTVSARQIEWIEAMARRYPRPLRLVAAHHPLVQAQSPRHTRRVRRHDALFRALEAADVAACLSGHLHQSFSGLAVDTLDGPGSILAIHASTATSSRLRGHANAYNQIVSEGPLLSVNAVGYNGHHFETLGSLRYERRREAWHLVSAA